MSGAGAQLLQFDGQAWAPSSYTAPLTGRLLDSDGPRLVELLEQHWRQPDGTLVRFDVWQKALLNHLLERYPADWPDQALAGRIRYRQAVASIARQNGKSLIGGALALYGLVQHVAAPNVIGIATTVDQANVIYNRVRFAVDKDPLLSQLLAASGTRGIRWRDGRGAYSVKPSKREGLQSVPITLGVADELHLMLREMWYSIVNGQRAQADALVAGITTAGDALSLLLKELYARGREAVVNPAADARFGFFLWEAPEGATIHTPGALEAANPALACGRLDRATVLSDVDKLPLADQQRYALNQFVDASKTWADLERWNAAPALALDEFEPSVIAATRSAGWEWVTLAAAAKHDGIVGVTTVASLRGVNRDQLIELLGRLADAYPGVTLAADGRSLSDVGKQLRDDGREVWILTQTETGHAAAGIYARMMSGTLAHDHAPTTRRQLATSKQQRRPDGSWSITAGAGQADAILATVYAAHVADVAQAGGSQLF